MEIGGFWGALEMLGCGSTMEIHEFEGIVEIINWGHSRNAWIWGAPWK